MVYIKVEDATNIVKFVSTNSPSEESGHTIYNEEYNGSYCWNDPLITVLRNGVGDYE